MKLPTTTRILLALLLCMVCAINANAAEPNLTCAVDITAGENTAECDGGSVRTNGRSVYVTPLNTNFAIGSVIWTYEEAWVDLSNSSGFEGSYSAPQQAGIVTVTFRLKSQSVKVTFDLNGLDATTPADQELTLGEYAVKPTPDPEQEGAVFMGWFWDKEGTKPFDFNTPLDHTLPYQYQSKQFVLKLYAGWEGIYRSGTCGKVDDDHDGSQLTWVLYRKLGTNNDSLIISGNGEMAENAFIQWKQLKTVVIEEGVTTIGQAAFRGCTSLASVTIPASVTTIGQDTFLFCTSLTSVNIPASVTTIGQAAFRGCTSLTSVTLPAGVTTIGQGAFFGCYSLTSVNIPASVTTIDQDAFYSCTSLTSVNIPASVTTIGQSAFLGCSSLTSVTIPASVTIIGQGAFWGCTNLTSVIILAPPLETYGSEAFSNNSASRKIYVFASYLEAYKAGWPSYADAIKPIGDVNNDGAVDASDIITIVRHLIGLNPQPFNAAAADANGDGAITIADVAILINTLLTSSQQGSNLDPYDDDDGDAGQAV